MALQSSLCDPKIVTIVDVKESSRLNGMIQKCKTAKPIRRYKIPHTSIGHTESSISKQYCGISLFILQETTILEHQKTFNPKHFPSSTICLYISLHGSKHMLRLFQSSAGRTTPAYVPRTHGSACPWAPANCQTFTPLTDTPLMTFGGLKTSTLRNPLVSFGLKTSENPKTLAF